MRRQVLQVTAVVLIAATVWALGVVAWMLWQGPPPGPGAAGAAEGVGRQVTINEVLAANLLRTDEGEELRLAGIEVPTPGAPFAEEGRQASRALAQGQRVTVTGEASAAYVTLPEGQLLQELLLAGGYARVAGDAPREGVGVGLRDAEQRARAAAAGIWGAAIQEDVTPEPILCDPSLVPGDTLAPAETVDNIGRQASVVFLPARATTENRNVTLLAGLTERDFGVVIPAGLASTVTDPALQYLNRCLAASGRIERGVTGAPRIVLRSFDQLLILR
jgi:hypothetical protein